MPNTESISCVARKRALAIAISACFVSAPAWANPTGPQVVNGAASFSQAGKLLTVNNSNGAIINWNTFSIAAGETTRFNQASAASSVLNRVVANDPSVLLGALSSNGKVWLVNPAGILVGQGAKIDVAGFIASTLNVRNDDFLAGRLSFGATPNAGGIQNYGQISTPSGGSVLLVAPNVENHGVIHAPNGEVILAAGQTAQIIDTGTPGVKVAITGAEGNATNLGEIVSEAGRIGMAGVLVKNNGMLNASSLVKDGGRIFLKASREASAGGSVVARSDARSGGRIEISAAEVSIPDDAVLDVSGGTKGGAILAGGGYQGKDAGIANAANTTIAGNAVLKADATGTGDGGVIVAWSDDATAAHGSFSARGGKDGGSGGLIETSGKRQLDVRGARVDTRAADGSAGTWLLDPADITIVHASATGAPNYAPTGSASSIADADIRATLATTNVSIMTSSGSGGSGNITFNGSADTGGASSIYTSGSGSRTLTLTADGNIDLHSGASISGNTSAPLAVNFNAGGNISHAGTINAQGDINFLAKQSILLGDAGGNYGYLYSTGSNIKLFANWDGASATPDVAATAACAGSFCGISGSGSLDSNYYSSAASAGAVTVKAAGDIDLSHIGINARGTYASGYGNAGAAGGSISVASTQGNVTVANIDASGGGGSTGMYGVSAAVNGGTGGLGGGGGSINLSTPGVLALKGELNVSGGYGGGGGNGYYDSTLASPAYTGAGGSGGAGGDAGTMALSGASMVLSGATLDASGGTRGDGAYYGTASGVPGANGLSGPVTIATAGDIKLTGYSNYAYGSALNLYASRSVVFGDGSGTGGYLYSRTHGAPVSVLANWNGSISSPDIADLGQCSDSFCGISGTGSINSNYYYYDDLIRNAGAVTVKAPGDVDLSGISIYANGGYAYGAGQAGGSGGAISIASTKGNLTVGTVSASGGGGSSGVYGISSANNGGPGGAGGAGGAISLSAAGVLTVSGSLSASGGGGGTGGSGYYAWDSATSTYIYSGDGADGGVGGNAGTITASGASVLLSGSSFYADGGEGSGGGTGTKPGLAAAGGNGGSVTLASSGDLSLGYVHARGGYGGWAPGGTMSNKDGGPGGAGGLGGSVSVDAVGVLTLSGTVDVSGGSGSGGGSGYSTWDSVTSTYLYSGTGGSGGAGGNAGTMSLGGSSLVLSGVTLDAAGGSGGSGGSDGATGGNKGAAGAASPVTLATAGDISLTNYSNYVYASELNLFAGKSITFGDTNGYGGYLNSSYGAPVTLLANWNGSRTAPDLASGGQCASASYCGISGSGSIDSNYYYYYDLYRNAGAVTIKAPGDIDLSSISIYAQGGSGYNSGSAGAVGGTVNISSTQGSLTVGHINANGGGGSSGTYGTGGAPNGGVGGVGGAGGVINLSAAGTLTLKSSVSANGGDGGSGGGGFYIWDTTSSTYVYSGTGGGGGAGGHGGSISASGATLALSNGSLFADGGEGGSGGQGTTAGLAAAGGNGGSLSVSSSGDLSGGYLYARGGGGGWGASGMSDHPNGGAGGDGGLGGSVSAAAAGALLLSGTFDVSGGSGNDGGSGYNTWDSASSTYAYSGTGGQGGTGGNAGTISVDGKSLAFSNATLDALGGRAGSAGQGAPNGLRGQVGSDGNIAARAVEDIGLADSNYVRADQVTLLAGKSIVFGDSNGYDGNLYFRTGTTSLIANWNGSTSSPDVAATAQCGALFCGIGGTGSIAADDYYYYYYDEFRASNGSLALKAAGPIDLGAISINSSGRSGGNYYYEGLREAGAGGALSVTSTQSDIALGQVDVVGGYGRYGQSGTQTAPNGAAGGAGGAGGSVQASAAGKLTLNGLIDASGGQGGGGGDGYYDYSLATPAYVGAGGAGGSGGDAGSITLSGGSILLDGANIRLLGGYPGSGSIYGSTAGAQGGFGSNASELRIGTSGELAVLGFNNLAANKVALLAGKSIVLGDSANSVSGDINSTAPDTLILANWNGSTTAPDVSATAQCGTVYCGISGSGSISNGYDYYQGYYYSGNLQNQNGGLIALKAAGAIDLTDIAISSIGGDGGSYYYLGSQQAGNGGTVKINSSQGDVALGDISVLGGHGRYGDGGTLTVQNGAAGGAGGTGGSIEVSAAGSLTAKGNLLASGGHGGTGGDGYYDYSLATPAYIGAGGAGGAGGNTGNLSLSAATLNLSHAMLYADFGTGGAGGQGASVGMAGAYGSGGGVSLSATADLNVSDTYVVSSGVLTLSGTNLNVVSTTASAVLSGSSVSADFGGDINLTASDSGAATLGATGGPESISAGGNIVLAGGSAGTGNFAALFSAGDQAVSASGITLSGGAGGGELGAGNGASIRSLGSQSITVGAGGLKLNAGGGGASNTDNHAMVYQSGGAGTKQTISVGGSGSIELIGGSSGASAVGAGHGSRALIEADGDAQEIGFSAGGAINLTGGTAGSRAYAQIYAKTGTQSIAGSPDITLTGGAGGGIDGEGNFAGISADAGSQTIVSGAMTLNAGAGGITNSAFIQAATQVINVHGNLALVGGGSSAGASSGGGGVIGGRGGSSATATNLTLAVDGNLSMTGGSVSGVSIGSGSVGGQATDIAIDVVGNVTLNPGSVAGAGSRIGSPASAVGAGNISLAAGGSIALNSGTGIRTAGDVKVKSTGAFAAAGGIAAGGMLTLESGGNLTLDSGAILGAAATDDALVLATKGNFVNNAGASALAAPNGRWLVYSTNPTLDTRGGLTYGFKHYATAYDATAYAGAGSGNGFIYSVAPMVTTAIGSVTKEYDGKATIGLLPENYVVSGAIDGDTIVMDLPSVGSFADKNVAPVKTVSANVALLGANNGAASVFGYQLASPTASGATASITQRQLSTWKGGASGDWSVASNWDALPDLSNVANVSIPAGTTGTVVTYDTAAGATNLSKLDADGLVLAGGSLTLNDALKITSSFSRTGGSLAFGTGASADITQASGNLAMPGATLASLALSAPAGAISQTGAIVATNLKTLSQTGTTLTDAGNKVSNFTAQNTGSGSLAFSNTAAFTMSDVINSGGNISVENTGAVTTLTIVSAPAGAVSIQAHSPLTIGGSGVSAAGNITLSAGQTAGTGDKLTLNGVVQSTGTGSTITLQAGDDLAQNADISANGGAVSVQAQTGNISMASNVKTSTGGGTLNYAASAGNVVLATLDAGSGAIGLNAGGDIQSAAGSSGANLTAGSAVIVAKGSANLSTQVQQLDVTVDGKFSIKDVLTGAVMTDVPATESLPTSTVPVLEQVVSTVTSNTQTTTTTSNSTSTAAKVEAAPPPPTVTTTGGTGPTLLANTNQTIGGTEGTFGAPSSSSGAGSTTGTGSSSGTTGSSGFGGTQSSTSSGTGSAGQSSASTSSGSTSSSSSDKPAETKPTESKPADAKAEDKPASQKQDEAKAEDKKEEKKEEKKEDKKKEESQAKKEDKPAPKKLATCS